MLTKEILESNVTGLTPEQIEAITKLNENDVKAEISANRKTWWDQLDADVEEVFGQAKPHGEKSHENHKNWLRNVKKKSDEAGNVETFKTQITQLEKERDELNEQIKNGKGNEMMKSQITDLERKLKDKDDELKVTRENLEKERDELRQNWESEKSGTLSLRVKNAIADGIVKKEIKFKDSIDESLRTRLRNLELKDFLSENKAEILKEGDNEVIVFRNANGEILRNKENGLHPFTPAELFLQRQGVRDLIDEGKSGQGGGGKPTPGGGNPTTLDLGEAGTQKTALKVIRDHIIKNEGIAKTDPKFATRQAELVKENNLLELPVE